MRILFAAALIAPIAACAPRTAWQAAGLDRQGAVTEARYPDGMDSIAIAQQVIAAERDFADRAQRDGQWTAFRATAAPGALLFWPEPTPVERALAGLADPPQAVRWQPYRVIVSCDGTMGATTGATEWPDGRFGSFTTIWRRQPDGGWRWIADHGDDFDPPYPENGTPLVEVAECPGGEGPEDQGTPAPGEARGGSIDNTLLWDWIDTPAGRGLRVTIWIGPRYAPTIIPQPPAR